jgi:outer membrane autotransporter protein
MRLGHLMVNMDESASFYVAVGVNLRLEKITANDSTLTFILPSGFKAGDVFVTTAAGYNVTFADAVVNIGGSLDLLQENDQFTLVDASQSTLYPMHDQTTVSRSQFADYTINVYAEDKMIKAEVAKVSESPAAKVYPEGVMGQVAMINGGSDLAAGSGTGNAVVAAQGGGPSMPAAFSAFSFGSSRYKTGSHVDVKSFSLIVGASYLIASDLADVTLGVFFEYGRGSYDTHNSFANYSDVNGSGDSHYAGGGLLSRIDFAKSGSGFTYAELALRYGSSTSEFKSDDLPEPVDFDFTASYFGLNAGLGHVFHFGDTGSLDVYTKYLWTRQNGKTVKLNADHTARFDAVNSHRVRIGGRMLLRPPAAGLRPYFGLAYEHDFGGKANSTIDGRAVEAPTLNGSTGMGEAGVAIDTGTPLNLELGVQGYVGKRQGVSGSMVLDFKF